MEKPHRPWTWRRRNSHPDDWTSRGDRWNLSHSFKLPFFVYQDINMDLDIFMKNAALRVSPSVVSLITYSSSKKNSGGKKIFCGSGTIIGCDHVNGIYHGTILSSATLVRRQNDIAENIQVDVFLSDGKQYEAKILTYDMHLNLLFLEIQSNIQLPTANMISFDDSAKIGPKTLELRSYSNSFHIVPGETVTAVGRYYKAPYNLMAAAGFFSVECCDLDCKELFRMNCKITKSGIGGPVVNRNGEVIGMSFYAPCYTPFLPINVALEWWAHFKKNEGFLRPQLGIQVANLYTADLEVLDQIIQTFPDISQGVIVEKVKEGSPFDTAGIRPYDVIVQCSGKVVQNLLQFYEISRDKVGESVELVVIRPDQGACLNLSVVVAENIPDDLNCWPVPKETWWEKGTSLIKVKIQMKENILDRLELPSGIQRLRKKRRGKTKSG